MLTWISHTPTSLGHAFLARFVRFSIAWAPKNDHIGLGRDTCRARNSSELTLIINPHAETVSVRETQRGGFVRHDDLHVIYLYARVQPRPIQVTLADWIILTHTGAAMQRRRERERERKSEREDCFQILIRTPLRHACHHCVCADSILRSHLFLLNLGRPLVALTRSAQLVASICTMTAKSDRQVSDCITHKRARDAKLVTLTPVKRIDHSFSFFCLLRELSPLSQSHLSPAPM